MMAPSHLHRHFLPVTTESHKTTDTVVNAERAMSEYVINHRHNRYLMAAGAHGFAKVIKEI